MELGLTDDVVSIASSHHDDVIMTTLAWSDLECAQFTWAEMPAYLVSRIDLDVTGFQDPDKACALVGVTSISCRQMVAILGKNSERIEARTIGAYLLLLSYQYRRDDEESWIGFCGNNDVNVIKISFYLILANTNYQFDRNSRNHGNIISML